MTQDSALILRRMPFREADFILSLLTKGSGKVSGLARNAKSSMKRFGGRLEPFIELSVNLKEGKGGMLIVEDVQTERAFGAFMQDIELFTWGSFLLEFTDALLPLETPNEELYTLLVDTLAGLDSGKSAMPLVLGFQLDALTLSGYGPNLETCVDCGDGITGESYFSIKRGGAVCGNCTKKKNSSLISREFLEDRKSMDIYLSEVLKYIKLFTKFTEYHTERELKSGKFIEELTSDEVPRVRAIF